jgi:four helix bundle protein
MALGQPDKQFAKQEMTEAGTTLTRAQMREKDDDRRFDLEERTYLFALEVRRFIKRIPRNICNVEDGKQLVRSSGSVGANYIEANEALSKKDFLMRVKISRKEAKESRYWLKLIDVGNDAELGKEKERLTVEAQELMNIFGAIFRKSEA